MGMRSPLLAGAWLVVCCCQLVTPWTYTPINKWLHFGCTPENVKDSNTHYYCEKDGTLKCFPGWSVPESMCQVPVCEGPDGQLCIHGNCTKPYTCQCDVGWTGPWCDKCVKLPGCVNGKCTKPFECQCEDGWTGMNCDQPVCENCVHGDCVMPGMCSCHPGWFGTNCTECQTRKNCGYGRCVDRPFQCKCYSGYGGRNCDNPVCKVGCNATNGYCDTPETCRCKSGWQGKDCSQCVPLWNCVNGDCVNPWECICRPGFFGPTCSDTESRDGNWGEWAPWSECTGNCGNQTRNRRRLCDNPKPSGDGKYCSLDGSECEETEDCSTPQCPR